MVAAFATKSILVQVEPSGSALLAAMVAEEELFSDSLAAEEIACC